MRAGRVAVDGVVAQEPVGSRGTGRDVTLDGDTRGNRGQAGVLVALVGGDVPPLAHPSDLHLAGISPDGRLAVLLSDERLARRLRALGYDAGRLGGLRPEAGAFRPLDAGELDAARGLARAAQRARARARDA